MVCSHPSCRNAGVKFRYCSFCKAPVAKRNFRRRHNHGGDASTLESDDMEDENIKPATVNSITSCRIAPKVEDEREKKRTKLISSEDDNVDTTTDSSKSSSDNGRKANTNESHIKQERSEAPPKNAADNTTREGDSSTATIKTSGKSISQEQREAWAKLLEERPVTNDSESMSVWIDKILKVSDPVE